MKVIKWGIIGAGKISSKFAAALNSLADVEITAVASRDGNRAKKFAEQFHIKKAYGSYEEISRDPEIDVIYIGTPHTEHKSNAALCITNQKAVLCEKPFTVNRVEAQYLIDLSKQYDTFLMEAMWTRFLPVTKQVKKWLKEQRIGKIKYLNASFGFYAEYEESSRLFSPTLAGGALLDVGIYPVSYVVHLLDKLPDHIASEAYLGKSGIDEMNGIVMRYEEGILADLSSAISVVMRNDAVIIGEKGKIVIPKFWSAEKAELYNEEGRLETVISRQYEPNGYIYEAEEVNRCLREGSKECKTMPLQDTLDIIGILDQLRLSWGLEYPGERG